MNSKMNVEHLKCTERMARGTVLHPGDVIHRPGPFEGRWIVLSRTRGNHEVVLWDHRGTRIHTSDASGLDIDIHFDVLK